MALSDTVYRVLAGALVFTACAERLPEPQIATSATSPGYAERFPTELNSIQRRATEQEREARELMGKFSGYPDAVEPPASEQAIHVARYADQEGRSQAYVEHLERAHGVAEFYEQERDAIRSKVGGAVQYEAKRKNCDAELGGTATLALDKIFAERLEKSLHEASDAHALIERNEETLGKKNAEALGTQADEISRASYLSHVGVVRTKVQLNAMLTELDDVKATLDRTMEDLKRLESQETDEKRRAALVAERVAVSDARRRVDVELSGAKNLNERMDARVEALKKEYTEAFQKLIDALEKRAPTE